MSLFFRISASPSESTVTLGPLTIVISDFISELISLFMRGASGGEGGDGVGGGLSAKVRVTGSP